MTVIVSANTAVYLSGKITSYSFPSETGYADGASYDCSWYSLFHQLINTQFIRAKASEVIFQLANEILPGGVNDLSLSLDLIRNFGASLGEHKVHFYNFIYTYIRFGAKALLTNESGINANSALSALIQAQYDYYTYDVEIEEYFLALLGTSAWSFIYSSSDNTEVYAQVDNNGFIKIEGRQVYSRFPTSVVQHMLSSAQNHDTVPYNPFRIWYWQQASAKAQVSPSEFLQTFSCNTSFSCDLINSEHEIVEKFISDEKQEHLLFINAFRGLNPRIQRDSLRIKRTTKIRLVLPITTECSSFTLLDGLKPVTLFRFAVNMSLQQTSRYKNTITALFNFLSNLNHSNGKSLIDEEAWLEEVSKRFAATNKYYDAFKEIAKNFKEAQEDISPVRMCANTELSLGGTLTPEQYKYQGVKLIKTVLYGSKVELDQKQFNRLEKNYKKSLSRKSKIEECISNYTAEIKILEDSLHNSKQQVIEAKTNLDSLSESYFSKKQELETQAVAIEAECFAIMETDPSYNWLSKDSQSNIELKECYYFIPVLIAISSEIEFELKEFAPELNAGFRDNRIPLSLFPKIAYYATNGLPVPLSLFLSDECAEHVASKKYESNFEKLCIPRLLEVNFCTKNPSLIKVDGSLERAVVGGPYNVQLAQHPGFIDRYYDYTNNNSPQLTISLKDSNSIFGFHGNKFKIHPHTNDIDVRYLEGVDVSSLSSLINKMVQASAAACLGDALPSIYKGFTSADIKLLVYSANAWIESANSTDVWGAYYEKFPHHTLVRFDQEETEEKPETKEITMVDIVNIIDELQENISLDNSADSPVETTDSVEATDSPVETADSPVELDYVPFVILP